MDRLNKMVLLVIAILLIASSGAVAAQTLWGPRVDDDTAWEAFDARFPMPSGERFWTAGFGGTKRVTTVLWQREGGWVHPYYLLTMQLESRVSPTCVQSYGALVDARTGELRRSWRDLSPSLSIGCSEDIAPLWE
ncbi:MAG: hypothetical protein ACM3ZA_14370 [Bacillota bacterium]